MITHLVVEALSVSVTLCGITDGPDARTPGTIRSTFADPADLGVKDLCVTCARRLAVELGEPVTYVIPSENRAAVEERITKLNRRAEKLSVPPVRATFEYHHTQKWSEGEGSAYREYAREWTAVTIEGASVRLAGWEFLATLHHTTDGNIIAAVPGHDVPREYRNAPSACGHCRTTRTRSLTYLLRNVETREVVQVGSSCLVDFLGGDPHAMASWAEMLGAFASWFTGAEDEERGRRPDSAFSLEMFLGAVVRVVRMDGWVSKKRAQESNDVATASTAWRLLTVPSGCAEYRELEARYAPLPEDSAVVRNVLTWATDASGPLSGASATLSDYEHNLSVVVRSDLVNLRVAGLAASLVQAWRRATQVAEERRAASESETPSNHVGTVGERLRDVPVTVAAVIAMPPTEWGPRELVKLKDDAGNLFAWFTGSLGSFHFAANGAVNASIRAPEPGDRMWVTGTVKRHSSFAGAKQTELTRCALASTEPIVKVKKTKKAKA